MLRIILLLPLFLLAAITTQVQAQTTLSDTERAALCPTRTQFMVQAAKKWTVSGYKVFLPDFGVDSVRVLLRPAKDGNGYKPMVRVARMTPAGWVFRAVPKKDWGKYVKTKNLDI